MTTSWEWQEDDESKFMDFEVADDSGRVVRLRVLPAPPDVPGGGSLITFESESDISDLQSHLRTLAMNIAKQVATKAVHGEEEGDDCGFVEEDRGVTFRGVKVMTYSNKVQESKV